MYYKKDSLAWTNPGPEKLNITIPNFEFDKSWEKPKKYRWWRSECCHCKELHGMIFKKGLQSKDSKFQLDTSLFYIWSRFYENTEDQTSYPTVPDLSKLAGSKKTHPEYLRWAWIVSASRRDGLHTMGGMISSAALHLYCAIRHKCPWSFLVFTNIKILMDLINGFVLTWQWNWKFFELKATKAWGDMVQFIPLGISS